MESDLTPAQNDIKLSSIYSDIAAQERNIQSAEYTLTKRYSTASEREQAQRKVEQAQDEIRGLSAYALPYELRYRDERWSRFYLVTNGNGHVHKDTSCTTCFITTQFAWLPDCSGMTEDEIVAEFGERVCTVCYPTAPVTPGLVGRRDREAQEQKQSEKAAKQVAKLEKALLPNGQPLKLDGGEGSPTTLIAGRRMLSNQMESLEWYGETHPSAQTWRINIEMLIIAIANKTGEDPKTIRETTQAKVVKKVAKEKAAPLPPYLQAQVDALNA